MSSDSEHRRMRWASRRGMLELDLLLEPFVDTHYASLDADDRERYRLLMGCQDQDLYAWLMGRQEPGDPELAAIVRTILKASAASL
jgi:antitoxin CptB